MPSMMSFITMYSPLGKAENHHYAFVPLPETSNGKDLTRRELINAKIATLRKMPAEPITKINYIYFGKEGIVCI